MTEKEMTRAEELLEQYEKDGWKTVPHFEKKPFVEWDEIEAIEGFVGEPKIIPSKYKNSQGEFTNTIIPFGEHSVNISGVLSGLEKLTGKEVVIIRDQKVKSTTGNDYWTFHVLMK